MEKAKQGVHAGLGRPRSRGGSLALALVRGDDDEAEVRDSSTYSGHLIGKARLEPQFL